MDDDSTIELPRRHNYRCDYCGERLDDTAVLVQETGKSEVLHPECAGLEQPQEVGDNDTKGR